MLAIAGAALGLAANPPGIHPRPAASDYPASDSNANITVAASILPPEQVRNTFATDLNHGYIVIEVAVYRRNGSSIDVSSVSVW